MNPQSYTIGKAISPFLSDRVTYKVIQWVMSSMHFFLISYVKLLGTRSMPMLFMEIPVKWTSSHFRILFQLHKKQRLQCWHDLNMALLLNIRGKWCNCQREILSQACLINHYPILTLKVFVLDKLCTWVCKIWSQNQVIIKPVSDHSLTNKYIILSDFLKNNNTIYFFTRLYSSKAEGLKMFSIRKGEGRSMIIPWRHQN